MLQRTQQNNDVYITCYNGSLSIRQVDHTELDTAVIIVPVSHPIAAAMFANHHFEDGKEYVFRGGILYTLKYTPYKG